MAQSYYQDVVKLYTFVTCTALKHETHPGFAALSYVVLWMLYDSTTEVSLAWGEGEERYQILHTGRHHRYPIHCLSKKRAKLYKHWHVALAIRRPNT